MKKYTLIISLSCLLIGQSAIAQKAEKKREIGIYTTELLSSNFGAQYKASLKNDWYWTIEAVNANGIYSQTNPPLSSQYSYNDLNLQLGFNFGLEKHKLIGERLTLFTGPRLITFGRYTRFHTDKPNIPNEYKNSTSETYQIGLGWTIGAKVKLTENLSLGGFITPALVAQYSKDFSAIKINPSAYLELFEYDWDFIGNLKTNSIKLALYYHW